MKLPNLERAQVSEAKVVDYLLNPSHPDGASKGRFFAALGFERGDWRTLADALVRLVAENDVAKQAVSPYGEKFIVDGAVRTVWIIDTGADVARLVSAYPHEGEEA